MPNRAFQNRLVNFESRSDIIDFGRPCNLNMLSKNNLAMSGAVAVTLVGIKCTIFDSKSTTTRIESYPFFVFGNPVMKSIEITSQVFSGMSNGCIKPAGFCRTTFAR